MLLVLNDVLFLSTVIGCTAGLAFALTLRASRLFNLGLRSLAVIGWIAVGFDYILFRLIIDVFLGFTVVGFVAGPVNLALANSPALDLDLAAVGSGVITFFIN